MSTTVIKLPRNNNILSGSSSATLVPSREMMRVFGNSEDYVELHVANPAGNILYSVIPFKGYSIPGTFLPTSGSISLKELLFDPSLDLKNLGLQFGEFKVIYNILRPKIDLTYNRTFFIKEISADRTEIRLSTNNISNSVLQQSALDFIYDFQSTPYFKEFYLNLGQNRLIPAINIALDLGSLVLNSNIPTPTILIKLLNPLPTNIDINTLVSIVDAISNPQEFSVSITIDPVPITFPTLRGPNFDLDLDNLRVGPTPYFNFNQITSSQASFGPLQQLLGQLSASNFAINIDYDNFEYTEWVHFSSAARRLEGFKYKLNNIELYSSASSSAAASSTPTAQLDAQLYKNKINQTIQNFDGFEQHLFYTSGSFSWPKQNSVKPFVNYSVTSSQAISWYSGSYLSASLYDDNNQNYLLYAMPGYIAENNDNELVFKFVASIGQMFDDIWIHIKAITDLYKAKNALDQGISKDVVYFALQSMGIDTYTDEDGTNVFKYLYGVNPDGSYLPNTGSYQTLISASQYQIPGQDQQKGIYKRLYHNLPLLLKSKGTTRFIQYLNTIFGIPPTVMSYLEYGGVDKTESTSEYEYDRFTYTLNVSGSNTINIPWNYTSQSLVRTGYNDIAPNGIEFRFRAYPTASNILLSNFTTQSLFYSGSDIQFNLLYTSTASANSIYSGSVGDFGYFQFKLGGLSVTSSTIPIYQTGSNTNSNNNTDWYSVLVQRTNPNLRINETGSSQTYEFFVKNNVWGEVGHKTSASLTTNTAVSNSLWYQQGAITFGDGSYPFSGSLQELRLWSNYVSESAFNSHVLNPESIEGNYTSSAYNDLAARFTLGNNLYTYNHSVTTAVNSTAPNQTIQGWTASFSNFSNQNNYVSFVETYYADTPNSGYANPVTDKIRIVSSSLYGTQLLPNKSIILQPTLPTSKDIHLLDAGLSPQDEINKDIIAQLGSTYTIDEFIGDPRGSGYKALDNLRFDYFKKYINTFNYKDFITLISYFHNSLFRTLKDFTPARTNVATGIVIKPHLLERPDVKILAPQVARHNNQSGSINTLFITASNSGDYSQSLYNYTVKSNLGLVTMTSDGRDFFTGELPSSSIFIHDDFDIANFNPFAINFKPKNTSSYSESIWNVEFNPLLNNVELNQNSNIKKKITLISGNAFYISGSQYVTESYQYQDFTDTYQRHTRPRYEGSTTTSTLYNVFSNGDTTFGKTATIDKNTRQFAFFSEVAASGSDLLSMPERSNVYIKYLIDENSNLTELTKRNYDLLSEDQKYNLYQVQNTFKSGETINIGLFDNQNPSKQQILDGNKPIFAGGFRFYPVLWNRFGDDTLNYILVKPKLTNVSTQGGAGAGLLANFNGSAQSGGTQAPFNVELIDVTVNYIGVTPLSNAVNVTGVVTFDQPGNIGLNFLFFSIPITPSQLTNTVVLNTNHVGTVTNITTTLTSVLLQSGGGSGFGGLSNVSTYLSSSLDPSPFFKVHVSQSNVLIASKVISEFYYNVISGSYVSEGFYFDGDDSHMFTQSLITMYGEADYPFILNSGDLVRLHNLSSSAEGFSIIEEYEVINVHTPTSLTDSMSLSLNRNIDLGCIQSFSANNLTGSISKYIFSRRIPDETNIVISYKKRSGQTSAGIVKNINLAPNVDVKLANIVSDLKSKIFSTVLIP